MSDPGNHALACSLAIIKREKYAARLDGGKILEFARFAMSVGERLARAVEDETGGNGSTIGAEALCERAGVQITSERLSLPGYRVRAVYTHDPPRIKIDEECLPSIATGIAALLGKGSERASNLKLDNGRPRMETQSEAEIAIRGSGAPLLAGFSQSALLPRGTRRKILMRG